MNDLTPKRLATVFHQLCEVASRETLPRFRRGINVINKLEQDFDPVTEADREAERAIRDVIAKEFPSHGIIGEEFDNIQQDARFQWIIDPIDGTRAFISGVPVWGTLIGLYENGKPIAGVMDQPFTGERYLAVDGQSQLFREGDIAQDLKTRSMNQLSQATLMTTSPHLLQNEDDDRYFEVEKQANLTRYGCDCYAYCLLAAGHIDLVIESGLNIYDIAALIPIIENAGGLVTNWQGGDAAKGGQILAAGNEELHAQTMAILNK